MEAMFSNLRRHQRRISGRKSTVELRDFGQYQVLFIAENEKQLLEQIQQVPITEYKTQRQPDFSVKKRGDDLEVETPASTVTDQH
jgi:hypothetical protein